MLWNKACDGIKFDLGSSSSPLRPPMSLAVAKAVSGTHSNRSDLGKSPVKAGSQRLQLAESLRKRTQQQISQGRALQGSACES